MNNFFRPRRNITPIICVVICTTDINKSLDFVEILIGSFAARKCIRRLWRASGIFFRVSRSLHLVAARGRGKDV